MDGIVLIFKIITFILVGALVLWLSINIYFRSLVLALLDILDYTRFRAACEIRELYLQRRRRKYTLEEFRFALKCLESQQIVTARECMKCHCNHCDEEFALSFNIRRPKRRKRHRSAWLEVGELVPVRI